MSTTIQYKGNTLATVSNDTKTLKTAGKYMEGDVILTDVTSGGSVTQDQDGFIVLPPDGEGTPSVGGLEYETGTWTPSEDVASYTISFTNTHTTAPFYYMVVDTTGTYSGTTYTNYMTVYSNFHQLFGASIDVDNNNTFLYGVELARAKGTSATSFVSSSQNITIATGDSDMTRAGFWATETGITAYTNSDARYWRSGRTYKWIAVWAPTT